MSAHSDVFPLLGEMNPTTFGMSLRIAFALLIGCAVGLERQWRAGLAGLRTNALVSVGAALFVVMGAYGFDGSGNADPTRVAAQVVSGIGFLGAGVIFREGVNVKGLNTAATLWCSAALGCLAGMGMYALALVGTVLIVLANIFLRPLGRMIRRRAAPGDVDPEEAEYIFEVITNEKSEPRVRALLLQTLNRPEYRLQSISASHKKNSGSVALQAEIHSTVLDPGPLERAVSRMTLDPKVSTARWWMSENTTDEY